MNIPERTQKAIDRFVDHGEPKGGFLKDFLSGKLSCIKRADHQNLNALVAIFDYCYNHIPSDCWGTEEKYNAWIAKKRKERESEA